MLQQIRVGGILPNIGRMGWRGGRGRESIIQGWNHPRALGQFKPWTHLPLAHGEMEGCKEQGAFTLMSGRMSG